MSIMQSIFGRKSQESQQQNVSNNPSKNPASNETRQSEQTDPNGVVPPNAASPLDQHKQLWEPTPVDPNAPKPVSMPKPEEIMAATSKVDFKQVMDPTLVEKVKAGGEDSNAALLELMNRAVQAGYGQSVVAAQKLVETAVAQKTEEFQSSIPVLLKKQTATEQLFRDNPGFSNPVVAPVVQAIANQLSEKYPKASSDELIKMAKQVLSGTAEVLSPPPKQNDSSDSQTEDWSAYLGEESPFAKSKSH